MINPTNAGELQNIVSDIAAMKPEEILKNKDEDLFGTSYSPQKVIAEVIQLYRRFEKIDFEALPHGAFTGLRDRSREIKQGLNELHEKSPREVAQGDGQSILNGIRNAYNKIYSHVSAAIALYEGDRETRTDVENLIEELEGRTETAKKHLEELNRIRDNAQSAAEEVGITEEAQHFLDEANSHKSSSRWWAFWTILSAILTIIAGGYVVVTYTGSSPPPLDLEYSIQVAIGKLVIFSVLVTMTITAARIFRSHLHNYVVNKHRANSLSSFQTFVDSSKDEKTKEAIRLQATRAIFAPQHTGYTRGERDSRQGGTTNIYEMAKSLTADQ